MSTTSGTLRTDTLKFGIFWLGTILVIGALTFVPALVLGPIAIIFMMALAGSVVVSLYDFGRQQRLWF